MQTANFVVGFSRLDIGLIEVAFDSHLLFANSVGLEPMNFRKANRTIIEAHIGNPFQLSPAPFAIALLKHWQNSNAASDRNGYYVRDSSYDFKVHRVWEHSVSFESCEIIVPKSISSPDPSVASPPFPPDESLACGIKRNTN
jgi:hypothetical protein